MPDSDRTPCATMRRRHALTLAAASLATAPRIVREQDWWENPTHDLLPLLRRACRVRIAVNNPTGSVNMMRPNHLQPPFDKPAIRAEIVHRNGSDRVAPAEPWEVPMPRLRIPGAAAAALLATALAAPAAFAQPAAPSPAPIPDSPTARGPAAPAAEAGRQQQAQEGRRSSRIIGSIVYNDRDERIGTVDDLRHCQLEFEAWRPAQPQVSPAPVQRIENSSPSGAERPELAQICFGTR